MDKYYVSTVSDNTYAISYKDGELDDVVTFSGNDKLLDCLCDVLNHLENKKVKILDVLQRDIENYTPKT